MSPVRVIVIGGGAAGLVAAIVAGYSGADVTLLEKNERVGKKILSTGNGRCNLTNAALKITDYHCPNPEFVQSVLHRFSPEKTLEFFEYLGIAHKVEERGKVFPLSDQASNVLDVLRYEMEQIGVKVIGLAEVSSIVKITGEFVVVAGDKEYLGDRIVLATGGRASPQFGSNGKGYTLARWAGHRVNETIPALVPLKLEAGFLKRIKGVKFTGKAAVLDASGQTLGKDWGEILFTEYGVSGPAILNISRQASVLLSKSQPVYLHLSMINHLTADALERYLEERLATRPEKPLDFSLVGFINKRLIEVLLQEAGLEQIKKPAGQVTKREIREIARLMQNWRIRISGTTSWPNAQVTAGGIDVSEVNAETLESKLFPGIFFAGEILDVDGDCGGFNLQWAWSSGYLAGYSASVV